MQKRSSETRSKILKCAQELFGRNGYDATGVEQICLKAGVSKGAFYHHFPSKQKLFLGLLQNYLDILNTQFFEARKEAQTIPMWMMEMASLSQQVYEAAEAQFPLYIEFLVQAMRRPEVWKAASAPFKQYRSIFSDIIQKGIEEESYQNELDTLMVSRIVISMAIGLLVQAVFDPGEVEWEETIKYGISIINKGIAKEKQ